MKDLVSNPIMDQSDYEGRLAQIDRFCDQGFISDEEHTLWVDALNKNYVEQLSWINEAKAAANYEKRVRDDMFKSMGIPTLEELMER